jgi:phospholipid/cholesterol/gamma-HCH transport system permease protein
VAGQALSKGAGSITGFFTEVGTMMILTTRTIISAVRPPYPYGEELIDQFYFTLKLCWFPLLISTFALCLGAPGLQAAGPLQIFGALDRLGGFFVSPRSAGSGRW